MYISIKRLAVGGMKMKKESSSVDITLNRETDDIVIGDNSINITTENGIRIELPYEKAVVETEDKEISFRKEGDVYKVKKRRKH
jgi:hypothetical protein